MLKGIPKIISTSWGKNSCYTTSIFHATLSLSIKEQTFELVANNGRGEMTEQFARPSSHLSSLIHIDSHVPMCQTILFESHP